MKRHEWREFLAGVGHAAKVGLFGLAAAGLAIALLLFAKNC